MGEKSCAWFVGMRMRIRRMKTAEEDRGRKERLRVNGWLASVMLVP
jgi:hypothetical protein